MIAPGLAPELAAELVAGAKNFDIDLSHSQLAQFARYFAMLNEWNAHINLTALGDPAQIVRRHFVDSFAATIGVRDSDRVLDVGAGAGFPGAVIAIVRPASTVLCVDSIQKKIAFIKALGRAAIPNLSARAARHDALIRAGEKFDVAVSRATWEPNVWVTHARDLIVPNGRIIVMEAGEKRLTQISANFEVTDRSYHVDGRTHRVVVLRANP